MGKIINSSISCQPVTPEVSGSCEVFRQLSQYLGTDAPSTLWARGELKRLTERNRELWAVFGSNRCSGAVILKAHQFAQTLCREGAPTIGGYHSPIEKECLRLLLRGTAPLIICPARSVQDMRPQREWRLPLEDGRLLILSPFDARHRRPTAPLADRRNRFVAALADKVLIVHAAKGGKLFDLARRVHAWGKPVFTFDLSVNHSLLELGIQPLQ